MKKQMVSDNRKTKSALRNMHCLFIKVVQKTQNTSKTVNIYEAVMKWYIQVHWCSTGISSVETKSAADIMGRHTEFETKEVMVGFADFQRDMALQTGAHHCSSHFTYPSGVGGGFKREEKGI